jgi:hypothetical protein
LFGPDVNVRLAVVTKKCLVDFGNHDKELLLIVVAGIEALGEVMALKRRCWLLQGMHALVDVVIDG